MSDTETEWYPSDDEEIVIVNVIPETEPVITTCVYRHGHTVIPDRDDPCLNRGVWERFKTSERIWVKAYNPRPRPGVHVINRYKD